MVRRARRTGADRGCRGHASVRSRPGRAALDLLRADPPANAGLGRQPLLSEQSPRPALGAEAGGALPDRSRRFHRRAARPRSLLYRVPASARAGLVRRHIDPRAERRHARLLHREGARAGPVPPEVAAKLDPLRPHLARAALLAAHFGLERARATVEALNLIGL